MNGATAVQLWTIGLCVALALVVVSLVAIYLYMRKRQPAHEEPDFDLQQRITERLAQISTPAPPVDSRKTA